MQEQSHLLTIIKIYEKNVNNKKQSYVILKNYKDKFSLKNYIPYHVQSLKKWKWKIAMLKNI